MIDVVMIGVLAGVTWFVASEGAWSAGVTFLSVILAGLVAMNFFEPAAILLSRSLPGWDDRFDVIALLGLFAGGVFLLRMLGERVAPSYIQVHAMVDQVGRWAFGLGTGYVTMAILLTALHTAPVSREILGFTPERANVFGLAPDSQWLGFTQYVSEHALARHDVGVYLGAPPGTPHGFDAPYFQVGDPAKPLDNTFWSSFPIRYAMRRERIAGGGAAPAAPTGGGVPGGQPMGQPGVPASPGGGNAPVQGF
ncbi:CvpA family protein [bacterium]|nr:CvpA family protein [bacterium]